MESEYKLLKVKDKICHFARVTVEAQLRLSGIKVTDEIREPLAQGKGEVSRKHFSDWIDAALRGAQSCAEALVRQGQISGCRVLVVRVIGVDVDTVPEDVSCAAALATWQALNPHAALPTFDFTNSQWHIQFN